MTSARLTPVFRSESTRGVVFRRRWSTWSRSG